MTWKRLLALILVLALLLCACGDRATDPPGVADIATGRYMETEQRLPENLAKIIGLKQIGDDSLWLMGMAIGADGAVDNRVNIWSSGDLGATWTAHVLPWADEVVGVPDSAWFGQDDTFYFTTFIPEGYSAQPHMIVYEGEYRFYRGTLTALESLDATPINEASTGIGLKEIRLTDGGDLLINCARNLLQIDAETHYLRYEFPIGSVTEGRVITFDNWLLAHRNGQIEWHSLESGDLVSTLDISHPPATVMAADRATGDLFFANATGLYRSNQTEVVDQLIDGALVSLGKPNVTPKYLLRAGDSFVVICNDSAVGTQYRMYRYTFDDTAPAVPTREMRVYALEDNRTIRQAIGVFQQQNPDVRVVFSVGLESSPTVSDALRTLSTELLAGGGPDIMVLDGIPIASYVEQGALRDLSPLLGDAIAAGAFLGTMADTFRTDKGLYAVPARFTVPVLLGREIEGVGDIATLAAYYEDRDVRDIGIFKEALLDRLFDVASLSWFDESGNFDPSRAQGDLEALRRLCDSMEPIPEDDPYRAWRDVGAIPGWVAHHIYAQSYPASLAVLRDFIHLGAVFQMVGDGLMDPIGFFPEGGVYVPATIVGINAGSSAPELAEAFVVTVFSQDVLGEDLGDGYSTHLASLKYAAARQPLAAENNAGVYMDMTHNAVTGAYELVVLNYTWPAKADLDPLLERFAGLETPVVTDSVVRQLTLEELQPYLEGAKSIDEAMGGLQTKLQIYLSQ